MANEQGLGLLPVGSVVRLAGASDALVMVMGYEPTIGDVQADYLGVPYPMGLVDDDAALAFDASAVTELVHRGFWDEEAEAGVAAVRRFRAATDDVLRQVYEFMDTLTPERVTELRVARYLDMLEEEPEPDLFSSMFGEPYYADDALQPYLPDEA